jgi:signal transduction histidine kinase
VPAAVEVECDSDLPTLPFLTWQAPVRMRGALLGAVGLVVSDDNPSAGTHEKLLADALPVAALLLRNLQLQRDLQVRIAQRSDQEAQLRASRLRLVTIQDAERRRLERDIHDGAQQHLVALAMKLRLAAALSAHEPTKAREIVSRLPGSTHAALRTLYELTGGALPIALSAGGLAPALRAQLGALSLQVELEPTINRYPPDIEGAVYFCCLEAVQNAAKHARATIAVIRLEEIGGGLRFEVRDNGVGFDVSAVEHGSGLRNMHERLDAVGGRLSVASRPGLGTTICGEVPLILPAQLAAA